MEKKEITIEQLKNYLGYKIECLLDYQHQSYIDELTGIINSDELMFMVDEGDIHYISSVKPILYRLKDIDKFIPELGFVPINELIKQDWSDGQIALLKMGAYTHTAFGLMEWIFKNHFWPFGDEYFEQGLIIDKLRTT
jgi:hypothetical protein